MPTFTLDQAMQLAVQRHQAGRLPEAENIYRQILSQQPQHADALNLLGVLLGQQRRFDQAAEFLGQAVDLRPQETSYLCNLGKVLEEKGDLDPAITAYRKAIKLRPSAEVHNNLGYALQRQGHLDEAISCFRAAIQLNPKIGGIHYNLANALYAQHELQEAIASYCRGLELNPHHPESHNNLGNAWREMGEFGQAIDSFHEGLRLKPDFPEAHNNLGHVLQLQGKLNDAIAAYRQAIHLKPDFPQAYTNLGTALYDAGRLDEAVASHREAIRLNSTDAAGYNNLGTALCAMGKTDDAIEAFHAAFAAATASLPNTESLSTTGPDIGEYQSLPSVKGAGEALNNLGNAFKDKGRLSEAVCFLRRSVVTNPKNPVFHSNLALALNYDPAATREILFAEARRWSEKFADPLTAIAAHHKNEPHPDRPLRIGYVSADFWRHACSFFLMPLLSHHDTKMFSVTCYSSVKRPDDLTRRFQTLCSSWRNILGLSDDRVADLVREDQIDILVDLQLHTGGNRLLVFARKPAPVQVSWLGYPGTTGLQAIDYRISEPLLDPPGESDKYSSERIIRLPDSFWCYDPLTSVPQGKRLPAEDSGHVTFGCLNNFGKVNPQVLGVWSQILQAVPKARLLLLANEGRHRQETLQAFEASDSKRVQFVKPRHRDQYLELFRQIDISLDPFPYNGHTTNFDSFWSGVPVITLVGRTAPGRAGLSQLMNLGLSGLIAETADQYIRIARELAADRSQLIQLRTNLRQRMASSPLMDGARFTAHLEMAFRAMWRNWCTRGE